MRKFVILPILLTLIFSSVEIGSAGVRPDLDRPSQGIRINEGFMPRVNVPVLLGSEVASNPPILRFCSTIFDDVCTKSAYLTATSHLPPCDAVIKVNCISAVYAIDENRKTVDGKFIKLVPESSSRDFGALANNNLPQGKGQGGIWQLPGITHSGGNDNYYVTSIFFADLNKTSGVKVTDEKFKIKRIEAVIGAVNEQSGLYSPQFALDASNPSQDGSANGGAGSGSNSGAADQDKCLVFGVGTCQMPQNFPKNMRFGISIVLGEKLQGWFHGRIYKPQINITNNQSGGQIINIEAEPVTVPTIEKLIPTSQISEDLRKYLSLDRQLSGGGGYLIPGSSGQDAFDQAKLWLPLTNDKASTSQSVWTVRTLQFDKENWSIRNCSTSNSQLSGIVTTNSLVYSAGPPAYNQQTQTLDYKLISPHLNADDTEAIGTYDLVLKSDVARCIYGFSNAPVQASISIVGENGENKIATTVINEKNGWLYLSANGFTYSSPMIKVKLSQKKNQKYSITCIKGKTTKKITGINPKCSKGYKVK